MNSVSVMVIVEGSTEEYFVNEILAPALATKNIWMYSTKISKPGQKGGDVKFERIKNDIVNHLKQRPDIIVTTFIDYYKLKDWPEMDSINNDFSPSQIATILNDAAMRRIKENLPKMNVEYRYIPFVMVHEFEALLYSNPSILAKKLGVDVSEIEKVIHKAGGVERVNGGETSSPSKRIYGWHPRYIKTVDGIDIAKNIGIEKMRQQCHLFDEWLYSIESRVLS